jgi:hypothetical protein
LVWGASPCRPMEGKSMDSLHTRGCWPSASVTAAMVDGATTSGGAPNRSHRCCRATSTEWWCRKRRPAELQSPNGRVLHTRSLSIDSLNEFSSSYTVDQIRIQLASRKWRISSRLEVRKRGKSYRTIISYYSRILTLMRWLPPL